MYDNQMSWQQDLSIFLEVLQNCFAPSDRSLLFSTSLSRSPCLYSNFLMLSCRIVLVYSTSLIPLSRLSAFEGSWCLLKRVVMASMARFSSPAKERHFSPTLWKNASRTLLRKAKMTRQGYPWLTKAQAATGLLDICMWQTLSSWTTLLRVFLATQGKDSLTTNLKEFLTSLRSRQPTEETSQSRCTMQTCFCSFYTATIHANITILPELTEKLLQV